MIANEKELPRSSFSISTMVNLATSQVEPLFGELEYIELQLGVLSVINTGIF